MQPGPGNRQSRDVAVGPDRLVAARVFGTVFNDAHVTSYDDFGVEVESSSVRSLGLVSTPGTPGLVADVVARTPRPERILIGLLDAVTSRGELAAVLAANPGVRPADVIPADGVVLVRLAPVAEVADADVKRVLAALRPAGVAHHRLLGRVMARLRP